MKDSALMAECVQLSVKVSNCFINISNLSISFFSSSSAWQKTACHIHHSPRFMQSHNRAQNWKCFLATTTTTTSTAMICHLVLGSSVLTLTLNYLFHQRSLPPLPSRWFVSMTHKSSAQFCNPLIHWHLEWPHALESSTTYHSTCHCNW